MPASLASHPPMSPLPLEVWERIERHSPRLLMLDFDGTLAPFEIDRMAVRVPARTREALDRIARRRDDRMAIITGRPIHEIRTLLGDLKIHMAGEHGWEERNPTGVAWQHAPPLTSLLLLFVARLMARVLDVRDLIEFKRASVVLHTRGLDSRQRLKRATRLSRWWRMLVHAGLRLDRLNGGYELRDWRRGKHTVVRGLLGENPGVLPVYIGDETSDEDAFAVLRPGGITIRVGTDDAATHAEWNLDSPEDVADFLTRWSALPEEGR